jgi:hypothetical protein
MYSDPFSGKRLFADIATYVSMGEHHTGIGEFGPVIEAGYRGFGLNGGPYHYFRTLVDALQGTSPELLEPVMRAVVNALEAVETLPRK